MTLDESRVDLIMIRYLETKYHFTHSPAVGWRIRNGRGGTVAAGALPGSCSAVWGERAAAAQGGRGGGDPRTEPGMFGVGGCGPTHLPGTKEALRRGLVSFKGRWLLPALCGEKVFVTQGTWAPGNPHLGGLSPHVALPRVPASQALTLIPQPHPVPDSPRKSTHQTFPRS